MKIAVMGTGAMGGYVGARLAGEPGRLDGVPRCAIRWGKGFRWDHAEARNSATNGLTRSGNSQAGKPPASGIVARLARGNRASRNSAASRKSGRSCSPL